MQEICDSGVFGVAIRRQGSSLREGVWCGSLHPRRKAFFIQCCSNSFIVSVPTAQEDLRRDGSCREGSGTMAWITVKGSAFAQGLEPTFQEALRGLAGSWTIEVHDGLVGGWWLLVFRRDDNFERTVLLSPMEQSPSVIRECVQETFRNVPPRAGSREQMLPPGVDRDRRATPRR